jgi:hypothetical protein
MTATTKKKTAARKTVKANRVDAALVADIERKIREDKSLARSKLPKAQLTASALADLEQQLVQRGLELTEKTIRVRIKEQILELLQGGTHVRRAGIKERVKGALKAEIDAVILHLVQDKQVHVVIRTADEMLVGADANVFSAVEMKRVDKVAEQLAAILKKVRAKGGPRTLLRDDIAALFEGLQGVVSRQVDGPPTLRQTFEAKLRSLEDPKLKLVNIPTLVRSFAGQFSTAEVHHALSEAAERGVIELHPDGGSEYLKPEDAALCPPGPRDTVLSRARILTT